MFFKDIPKNPFSDLLAEKYVAYIQNDCVFVPTNRGIQTSIQTPTFRISKPFSKAGTREDFETDYFKDEENQSTFFNKEINFITNPIEIFFHNLTKEYIENKPLPKIIKTTNLITQFHQTSPLQNTPTTILTQNEWITLGGEVTKQTKSYFSQNKTILATKTNKPLFDLTQKYQDALLQTVHTNKLIPEYNPVYNYTHKKRYFGKNAINREISIEKKLNQYHIKTHCPTSFVQREGKKYKFDETTLTTVVEIQNDELKLISYPYAPKGYEHFFVWDTGTICYDTEKRFENIGLTTSTNRHLDIKDSNTANLLKKVLDEGHRNLHFGDTQAETYAIKADLLEHKLITPSKKQTSINQKYIRTLLDTPEYPIQWGFQNGTD